MIAVVDRTVAVMLVSLHEPMLTTTPLSWTLLPLTGTKTRAADAKHASRAWPKVICFFHACFQIV